MRKKTSRPRVLIGDSSQAMLAFLEILLEPQFEVVSSETEAEAIVLTARKLAPELVILDFSLSFLEGLGAARQLYETMPNTKIIFFTLHEDPVYVAAAFEAGAMGYLVKHLTVDLGHYLNRVLQGERVCCPDDLPQRVSRLKET